ncbi:MAG: sigma-54-dependent Fis family transcriptional regulator [Tissierellales bacterium]|nr:sigma-54-dependent Fis family transcriptional regulator [Tissierellales bacterium]MBN2826665.1 sigma-54-dependent Fis family transcriptional regulator [Tissierellales bacterium]
MNVKELMIDHPIVLSINNSLDEATTILLEKNIYSAPVLDDDNRMMGIFTRDIILQRLNQNINPKIGIKGLINKDYLTIRESEDFRTIMNLPGEIFVVVDQQKIFVGLIRKKHLFKWYQDKLELSISNLQLILDSTNNAIISIDLEGNITLINDSARKILDIAFDEQVIGKHIHHYVPHSKLPDVIKKDERHNSELVHINNKKLIVNRSPVKLQNETIGAISVFQDITDYSLLEEKLLSGRNEIEVLNTIFEIAYDGLIVVDKDGYIKMISKAYKRFLGIENEDVTGKHVTEVIENTRLHVVAKTGIPEVADLQKIDGNYIIASRIPVFKEGKVESVVGKIVFRNISELDDFHLKINKLEKELEDYKDELSKINRAKYYFSTIIGSSEKIASVKSVAIRAAHTDSNILITGESGTGKELFAHAIHNESQRKYKPFVKVNCAAIPVELIESELFGYEAGAFTGASKAGKIGKFEVADGGTIFLDEIGDMPLHMQVKLLRVLQEKEIERIGSNKVKEIDVRIIAATNRNLEEMIKNKSFRLDLYYRLNVVTVVVPPLRERREDIKELALSFVDKFRLKYYKQIDGVTDEALKKLTKYDWKGNIRELENIIERAINLIETSRYIEPKHLPVDIVGQINIESPMSLKELIDEAESKIISDYLQATGHNKSKVAKLLGISRTALYDKIEKFGI